MARSLDQILTELHAVYDPQRDVYNKELTTVDPQQDAEVAGLESAKTDAFNQILTDAQRRGIFYGGMPIAEEQKYTGSQFLPSLANLRSKYTQRKFDLTTALNKVTEDEYNNANQIQQTELDREEKQREFDAQLAASSRASGAGGGGGGYASPSFGFGGASGGGGGAAGASYSQKAGGGYAFTGPNGQSISAATYSQLTGIPFRSLLQAMANSGDAGARAALGFVGNDYGYNPNMIGGNVGAYNALIWGAVNPKTGKPISQAKPYTPLKVNNTPAIGSLRVI